MKLGTIDWRGLALALSIGSAGGALFNALNLPLAWMIGAMACNTAASMAGLPVKIPAVLRHNMLAIIGVMLGASFTPAILDHLGDWLVSLSGLVVYTVVATLAGILFLRRVGGYDPITCYFTAMPGGFNEMVMVGGAMGGDDRTIALVHAQRIMLVVMTVPMLLRLIAGYEPAGRGPPGPGLESLAPADMALLASCLLAVPLARWLRIPAAPLVGPLLMSAAIHLAGVTDGRPPGALVAAAQVVVGSAIGGRFAGVPLRRIGRTALIAAGLTAVILSVTVASALTLQALTGLGLPALILAFAPGGVAEMSLVALALHIDIAFVATHHVARIFLIVMLAPHLFRLWWRLTRGTRPPPQPQPQPQPQRQPRPQPRPADE